MRRILFFCVFFLITVVAFAQKRGKTRKAAKPVTKEVPQPSRQVDKPVVKKEESSKPTNKRKPIQDGYVYADSLFSDSVVSYPKIEMKDVVYTKRIWRDIDFRDKGNRVLNSQVINIVAEIYKAIARGELDLYDNNDEDFKNDPLSNEVDQELTKKYGGRKTSLAEETFIGTTVKEDKDGNMGPALNIDKAEGNNVFFAENYYKIRLKEDWVLDAKRGVFEPRIVGLAVVRKPTGVASTLPPSGMPDPNNPVTVTATPTDMSNEPPEPEGQLVGWVPFEQLRPILQKIKVPNEDNDLAFLTFDDIFINRLFYSYITKVSAAGDKLREMKINGRGITRKELLEQSERIKNEMASFEQSLWEY